MDAYYHIQRVLEQVNVIMGVREVEDMMAMADIAEPDATGTPLGGESSGWTLDESADTGADNAESQSANPNQTDRQGHINSDGTSGFFSPERGNVAFASAIDGWAFRLSEFADIFSAKFGISKAVLSKTLWGNYYLQPKSKKIVKRRRSEAVTSSAKPMFVQFVLSSLHSVYDAVYSTQNDMDLAIVKREKIATKLGLKVSNRDLRHKDASVALRSLMCAWLPAAQTLLKLIVEQLPSAKQAQQDPRRLGVLWPHLHMAEKGPLTQNQSTAAWQAAVLQRDALRKADASEAAPVMVYVAKMLEPSGAEGGSSAKIRTPKTREELNVMKKERTADAVSVETGAASETQESAEASAEPASDLVAFARLYSGTLKVGDRVHVYGPRYRAEDVAKSPDSISQTSATVTQLHLLVGRDMEPVARASAGCVVGISGLGDVVLKTATVSSLPPGECLPLDGGAGSTLGAGRDSVVRVAVEPHLLSDVPKLQAGLRKLNQADPAVDTYVSATGEHVIAASGELHLERCLLDLRERFASGVQIHVSAPIVSFRESVHGGVSSAPPSELEELYGFVSAREPAPGALLKANGSPSATSTAASTESNPAVSGGSTSSWRVEVLAEQSAAGAHPLGERAEINGGRLVRIFNGAISVLLLSAPLPRHFATALDNAGSVLRARADTTLDSVSVEQANGIRDDLLDALERDAEDAYDGATQREQFVSFWANTVCSHVWSCGSRRFGANLLVGPQPSAFLPSWMRLVFSCPPQRDRTEGEDCDAMKQVLNDIEKAGATGFQLCTQSGPLCEEPLHGTAFFLGAPTLARSELGSPNSSLEPASGVSNLLISPMKDAMRAALVNGNPRLMEATLKVEVSVTSDALGKVYTVLAKRRARVLSEDMKDGVNLFGIDAMMPVTESFGFADALRKQTSGFASAQLLFSHWEVVEADPFWAPRTEEELEDLGVEDTTEADNNLARKLIDSVRKRKGLRVVEKIVENAEKQRTLSKKK